MFRLSYLTWVLVVCGLLAGPATLEAQGVISGTVTDAETGDPIAGAYVRAGIPGEKGRDFDFTNVDGEYEIDDLDAGTYEVRVVRFRYAVATSTVEVVDDETTTADFELEAPTFGTLEGTISDSETDEGLENAWVLISGGFRWNFARSDEEGFYSEEDVMSGERTVRVWKWGYYSDRDTVEVAADDTTTHDVALDPLTYGGVEGTVTDADTDDAIDGARVSIGWRTTWTDDAGDYALEDVVAGDRIVSVRKGGYFSDYTEVEIVSDETATHDVALEPLTFGSLSGVVTDSETGDPIEGARVYAGWGWWNSATTNADGEYSIDDLVVGDYDVFVSSWGYYSTTVEATIEEDADTVVDVELEPLAFGDIAGNVTDSESGDALEGARVSVDYSWWLSDTTHAAGDYLIEDILTGDRSVTASAAEHFSSTTTVTVEEDAEATADFALDPFTYGSISGVVTDADTGDPIEGARVQLGWNFFSAVYTDADGAYTLEDVLVGTRNVWTSAFGYSFDSTDVEVEEDADTTHDVALDPF